MSNRKQTALLGFVTTVLACLLFCGVCLFSPRNAFAGDDGRIDTYSDGLRVGSDGTKFDLLHVGTATVEADSATEVVTLSNVTSSDFVLLTPGGSLRSAATFFATPATGQITITLNTNPSSGTVVFYYLVLGTP